MTVLRLRRKLLLESGEGLYGFINRLAITNKIPYHGQLFEALGLSLNEQNVSPRIMQRLAAATGFDTARLEAMAWPFSNRQYHTKLGPLPAWMVHRYRTRICPQCLSEGSSHKMAWDFRPLVICPLHGCRLIDHCPSCQAPLVRRRQILLRCPRYHDLRRHPHIGELDVNSGEIALAMALEASLVDPPVCRDALPNDLQILPAGDIALMSRLLGALRSSTRLAPRAKTWTDADAHLSAIGFPLLADWPASLHDVLSDVASQRSRPLPIVAARANHLLKTQLRKDKSTKYARLTSAEIWQFAEARGVILMPGTYGFVPTDFHIKYISPTAAAKAMGVAADTVYRIAKANGWHGAHQLNQQSAAWLLRSDMNMWLRDNGERIYLAATAKRLGCDIQVIHDLVRHGCLGENATRRMPFDARATWFTNEAELQAFFLSLKTKMDSARLGNSERTSWWRFAHRYGVAHLSIGGAIAGVQAGDVMIAEWPTNYLRDLLFDRPTLEKFQAKMVPTQNAPSLTEVALQYGITKDLLTEALRSGLLSMPDKKSGNRSIRIGRWEMEAFLRTYATVTMFVGREPTKVGYACQLLKRMGIKRVNVGDVGRQTVSIFYRAEIEKILEPFRPLPKTT